MLTTEFAILQFLAAQKFIAARTRRHDDGVHAHFNDNTIYNFYARRLESSHHNIPLFPKVINKIVFLNYRNSKPL